MKKSVQIVAFFAMLAFTITVEAAEPLQPLRVTIVPADTVISAGSTLQFYADTRDAHGCILKIPVEWTMLGDAVGPLSSSGHLTADWHGTVMVTAAAGAIVDTARVVIRAVPVNVSFNSGTEEE